MRKRFKASLRGILIVILLSGAVPGQAVYSANQSHASQEEPAKILKLGQGVMCEDIKDYQPYNRAVVFSLEIGKVYCFSSFEVVPEKMFIYHNWYRQDKLVTTKRLLLQPPEWSTYSSIQLREADKGPWRVELRDQNNQLIQVVRFSITD